MRYVLSTDARAALQEYIERRQAMPHFANAEIHSQCAGPRTVCDKPAACSPVRDASLARNDLMTIEAADIQGQPRVRRDPTYMTTGRIAHHDHARAQNVDPIPDRGVTPSRKCDRQLQPHW